MRTICTIILSITVVMGSCNQSDSRSDEFITVDVTANYPEKELILQDFMDVEYIPLEMSDNFVNQGVVKAVGKEILIITNRRRDGDIFVFDRTTGKGLRKINRLGQGPEEYSDSFEVVLDEENQEIFIFNFRKISVYDLSGNFKRSFNYVDEMCYYSYPFVYDRDHLICHKSYFIDVENEKSAHILISKQDGSIAREIQLPFKEIIKLTIVEGNESLTPTFYLTVPGQTDWIIMRTSSDTIYHYGSDDKINPIIVRTPVIHSMDPKIFLFPTVITNRYYFIRTIKKEADFKIFKGFPHKDLVYDSQRNIVFEYTLYNDDFSNKQTVSLGQNSGNAVNHEVVTSITLNAFDLIEAYKEGKLKNKLKEIAGELDEEDNPVIMLVKHKK
ncbi:6-bladed beta-propeller [Proteiniphilum sp.]|uniref:6-bladed beta-propeller n=1 Tax=Proteiniphilum sp. TaxID=1926877 RepID=UPI003A59929A